MKLEVTKLVITGLKPKSSKLQETVFTDDRGGYFPDDSYGRDGIACGKIVAIGLGTKFNDEDSRTLFIADNIKLAVGSGDATEGSYPYGIVYHSSIPDWRDAGDIGDLHVLRPKKFGERDQLPEIRHGVFYVQGYDASGNKVQFPFEKEDIDKRIYLGLNGDITVVKPKSGYNKPIGRVDSQNTIIFDVENRYFATKQTDIVLK